MRISAFFSVVLLACLAVLAHDEVRDPVCGMMVDPETAPARAEFEGKTYWFCREDERAEFLADPTRYVSLLRTQRWFSAGLFTVTVDPIAPSSPGEVRIIATLSPRSGGTVETRSHAKLSQVELYLWRVDREHPPSVLQLRMPDMGGRAYGALASIESTGEWRGLVEARTAAGALLSATITFRADAAPESVPDPPPVGEFTMSAQHGVMKRMGQRWLAVERALANAEPGSGAILDSLDAIERDRALMPRFALHVNADAKPEFDRRAEDLRVPLAGMRAEVASGQWEAARASWRRIDAVQCTLCHLKFRWDVTRDLSRFQLPGGRR